MDDHTDTSRSGDLVKRLRERTSYSEILLCNPPRPAPDHLCHEAADRIEALEAENERLREALNPTNRRQAEYMNLFYWSEPDFDECGGRTTRHVSMPWPKIKQALAAIYARAALEETGQ